MLDRDVTERRGREQERGDMQRVIVMMMLMGTSVFPFTAWATDDPVCPKTLSHLTEEMDTLLAGVHAKAFTRAIRTALHASIPHAIDQADGINAHVAFLRQEIQRQARVETSAELIARDVSNNPRQPLTPCKRGEESGYCHTVERYFMAKASNLANRGFLNALECYRQRGSR